MLGAKLYRAFPQRFHAAGILNPPKLFSSKTRVATRGTFLSTRKPRPSEDTSGRGGGRPWGSTRKRDHRAKAVEEATIKPRHPYGSDEHSRALDKKKHLHDLRKRGEHHEDHTRRVDRRNPSAGGRNRSNDPEGVNVDLAKYGLRKDGTSTRNPPSNIQTRNDFTRAISRQQSVSEASMVPLLRPDPELFGTADEEESGTTAGEKDGDNPKRGNEKSGILKSMFVPPGVDVSDLGKLQRLIDSNIIVGSFAKNHKIKRSEFVKSSPSVEDCPQDDKPEFAFVGRSNVGKSSLINALAQRNKLALTSKKPGKTQLINHFLVNDSWYLVDLPGYGYAIAPAAVRTEWNAFTKDYFLKRKNLVCVFLLIDASIPAKKIDIECATWLGQNQIPMTFVFTKCDKKKKKKAGVKSPAEHVIEFQKIIREFYQETPPWIMTSSVTNAGRDELLVHMSQLRNYWLKH